MFRERFVNAVMAALLWVVVGLFLVIGYTYRFELKEVADRVVAEVVPGHVISHGRTVEVARTGDGDFDIAAHINGSRVPMVLDTGASSVVLTHDDAKAAGLPRSAQLHGQHRYRQRPHPRRARHARPCRRRRARRALGRGAGGAARPVRAEPARHEFPQPAAELAGLRRPADAEGVSVSELASQDKLTRNRADTSSRKSKTRARVSGARVDGRGSAP